MNLWKNFTVLMLGATLMSAAMLPALERQEIRIQQHRETIVPTQVLPNFEGPPSRDQWPDDFWAIRFKTSADGGMNWSEMMDAGDAGMWKVNLAGDTVATFGFPSLDFGSVIDADNNLHVVIILNAFSDDAELNPLQRTNGVYHVIASPDGEFDYSVIAEEGGNPFFYADAGIDTDGNLYALWCNQVIGEEGPESWEIWASKSLDMGESWSEPFRVAGELALGYNFAKITYHVGEYFYVIYQVPGEALAGRHFIAKVPGTLDGEVMITDTGLESSHPYYSYKFGACNPIDQDVAAGYVYFNVSDETRGGIHIGLSQDGENWDVTHYDPVNERLGPVARYPSLGLNPSETTPYVFSNYGIGGEPYHLSCFLYDELGYGGGSWTDPPLLADSVEFDGDREYLYIHQGVWTPAGAFVRGTSVWGVAPIEASIVTYWDDDADDWAARQRVVDIFADPPIVAASIADPTYLAGTENYVWAVYTGKYGETDMIVPVVEMVSVSSYMLEDDKVVTVHMSDDSGINYADPNTGLNYQKIGEISSGWVVEEQDSMDTDLLGSGTYWFHLPNSVMIEGEEVALAEGDTLEFYFDTYDNNANYGAEHNGEWTNLWIVDQAILRVSNPEVSVPTAIELRQNYPNPFNSETVIPFTVNRSAEVTLKVYDLAGREVATLFDGVASPGRHEVSWRAGSVPTGVYLYRMNAAGFSKVGKLALLR